MSRESKTVLIALGLGMSAAVVFSWVLLQWLT
jgi:hypothetical protein